MQRRSNGELITAEPCHQILFTQLRADPIGDRHQYRIAGGVTEVIVDAFEAVAVEKQHRDTLIELAGITQGTNQSPLEKRSVRQTREAVVAGLMGEVSSRLQVGLPGFEFIEQRIEVVAEVIQFGDLRRRYADRSSALAARAAWATAAGCEAGR